jgi:hypothetical protein
MTMIIDGTLGLEFPDGSDQTVAYTGNASTITTGVLAAANGGTGTTSYVATQWTTSGANISYTTGSVGIGTASPTFTSGGGLQVKNAGFTSVRVSGGSSTGVDFAQATDGLAYMYNRDNNGLVFGTNNTERMRITSSGGVGIGASTVTSGYTAQINGNLILGTTANPLIVGTTSLNLFGDNSSSFGVRITTAGGIAFGGASNFGSSGQVLQSNGDAPPTWVTASSIGVGQSWTNVGGSRSSGTTYTNSTGRAIQLMVATDNTGNTTYGSGGSAKFFINGNNVGESFCSNAANIGGLFQAIIPNGATYQVSASTIRSWWELR